MFITTLWEGSPRLLERAVVPLLGAPPNHLGFISYFAHLYLPLAFSVLLLQPGEIESWVTRLLPSRLFGFVVLTTSAGIMDHEEARRKHVGGKVLGFFY